MTRITLKQEIFALEYVKNGGNASEALRAAYDTQKMKPETIWRNAHELLKNTNVATRVNVLRTELNRKLEISAENALREIARIAFSDARKLFDENGNLKTIADLDDDTAAAIAAVDVMTKTDGESIACCVVKIRFWDKNAALEKLAKHFSLYADKVEHSVDDSLTRLLQELDGKTRLLPKLNR